MVCDYAERLSVGTDAMACHTGQDLPSAGRFRITPESAYWAKCRILHFAHHLRELAGTAELTGQAWPTQLAELLVETHVEVQVAKAGGRTKLTARRLAVFGKRYDTLIAEGKKLNPPPPRTGKRGRPALGPAGSLLARLETHRADVLRFATDFVVPFDNNQAERDVQMVKLQQKISGGWRSNTGAEAFLDIRSYLGTARKNGQSAMVVLRDLFTGQPQIPAVGASP